MATSKTTLEIAVTDLQLGMYVSELDRPWLDTPYLLQGILIQSQEDIDELARHCVHVHVDLDRSDPLVIPQRAPTVRVIADAGGQRTQFHGREIYTDVCTVEQELPSARLAHESASRLIDHIRRGLSRNLRAHVAAAHQAVDALRDSVVRNPDALLLLARLKSSGDLLYDHAINTSVHLLAFGRHLGLPKTELSALGLGGLLMDIGKLRLPADLLSKAHLGPAERGLIKEHVTYGEQMVAEAHGIPEAVFDIVSQHHEREDGSGYPRGLRANELNAFARMAAIVDCYEELAEARPGVPAASPFQALKELRDNSRWGLNPALVEQFAHCIGLFPVGSLVELSSAEVAIVLTHGRSQRFLPCVMIILDARKQPYDTPRILDLRAAESAAEGVRPEIVGDLPQGAYGVDPTRYYL